MVTDRCPGLAPRGARGDAAGLVIRPVQERDLGWLVELERLIFGNVSYPYFVLRQLFDIHQRHWLVAERDDQPCGYVLGAPSSDGHSGWLLGLGVHPDHRGLGLGAELTARSLRLLRDAAVRQVRLTVEPDSAVLVRLYEAAGFRVERTVRDYLGPGEDRTIMVAHLDPYADLP
ncbi:GNAT family N-acetyltransferase [Solihabitans fulvus]|uniref:GNAT family N-acetyltransferase n=1 Tax=Solihabitans fulvus TaxID=1892852 RepID=A0A5B2XRB6_9PSEU|nr:GNAT family N-acetyltransferase [Solihabitans fulvus]KAA2266488.1 GNAT family N-acetyltransferase [Solihabitans fulvus]